MHVSDKSVKKNLFLTVLKILYIFLNHLAEDTYVSPMVQSSDPMLHKNI